MSVYDTFMAAWNHPILSSSDHEEWPGRVLSAAYDAARSPAGTPGRDEVEAFMIDQLARDNPLAVDALEAFGLERHMPRLVAARATVRGDAAARLALLLQRAGWSWRDSVAHLIPLARQGAIYFEEAGVLSAHADDEVADALAAGLPRCAGSARSPIAFALLRSAGIAQDRYVTDLQHSALLAYLNSEHEAPRQHALEAVARWRAGDGAALDALRAPLCPPSEAQRAEFRALVESWQQDGARVAALWPQLQADERPWALWRAFKQLARGGAASLPPGVFEALREAPEGWVRAWAQAQGS